MTSNRWREINCAPAATLGYVKKVDHGWPNNPLPPRQVVHEVTPEEQYLFEAGVDLILKSGQEILPDGVYDFDKAIILQLTNEALQTLSHQNPQLSMDQFDGYIAHCEARGVKFW
jgi:hypothetical protein